MSQYSRDQWLQPTVVGDGGPGERPFAVRIADVEVKGGGLVCHETRLAAERIIVKRTAKSNLTYLVSITGGEGGIQSR